ncbi:MAG: hypothetical protein IJX38_05335 [Clostridia bacterium]|nr:hypothetical protein [Clostridia bacterium]
MSLSHGRMRVGEFISSVKKKGGLLPVLIVLLGVALLIFGIASSGTDSTDGTGTEDEEERLAELLTMIDGVGECRVMITYTTERVGYGSEVVRHVEGVAVLCTGGNDPSVKKRITEMTSALYSIGSNKVRVEKLG